MKFKITLLIALTVLVSKMGWGQVSIVSLGTPSTQNFAIGTTATASLPSGFKIGTDWSTGLIATTLAYGNTGIGSVTSASSGGAINWANGITGSSTERAIGFLSSGSYSSPRSIIFAFTNNTGSTISSLDISWNYEKYRSGSRAFAWSFFHGNTSTAATAATSGDQSYAADLANTTIYNPAQSVSKSFTISGLSITNGSTYYLRWTYTGSGGSTNAQGLGIDDFSLIANATTNYSLTYNGNGNTSGTAPVDPTSPYASGATVTTLGNTGSLAKTGSTFAGWNTAANGSGTGQAVGSTFSMPGANTVLYAQWTTNNYTVSFDANTGSGTMSNQTIAYGATANLVANTFTNTGYTFAGWNTASNGSGTTYADGATLSMGSSNITLFAQWTPIITTPIAQTITFGPLSNQLTGAADYSPGATASSGLTVTYTSSNPAVATIVGGLIHVVGPGTTTITASQAGNANYLAASDVTQSLTIVSAPLVLAAWDFTGENNVATSLADNYLSSVIYQPNLTRGSGALSSSANNSFRTVGFKNDGISLSNTDYFETTIMSYNSTLSLTSIDAQFAGTASYRATPGVTSQFAYSLDGINFSLIDVPVQTTSLVLPQVDLSTISSLQNLPLGTTITFRYYASGQTTTGGWGFSSSAIGVYGLLIQGYAEDSGTALPVEFIDFTATCNETNSTDLKWSTASEHNSDYFKVEKSTDGINWSILAKVAAAGNATERIDYAFVDSEITRGEYYKLWQYDVDGTANLLATIQEKCVESTRTLEPIIYPNPITDQELTIELRNDKVDFIFVQMYSMQGSLVYSQQMKATEQITLSKLNVDPGVYQLILQLDGDNVSSFKICVK
jgi:uncharacterized repeat protein (TIGR02543 family)